MQRKSCSWIIAGLIVSFAALLAPPAAALISISEGDTPVRNMAWPTGSEAVANFPGRLGYMEGPPFGGGEYYFRYQSKTTADFNEALQKFAAIRVPRAVRSVFAAFGPEVEIVDDKPLLLVVRDWPMDEGSSSGSKRVDWTFTIWIPENFYHLFNSPKGTFEATHPSFRQPVPPPRIDAFIGGDSPIAWDKVVVPPNVRVIDKRATAAPADRIGGVIRGSVFDMATHQVIARATVSLVGQEGGQNWRTVKETNTDDMGRFQMEDIPKGRYRIHVRAEGHAPRSAGGFDNRNGRGLNDLDVLLAHEAPLSGVVADEKGNPLPGIAIKAAEVIGLNGRGYQCVETPSAITDENGRFKIASLPEGYTQLRCDTKGLYPVTPFFEMYTVSSRPQNRQNKPEEIRLVLTATGGIRVKVTDKEGRPPKRQFSVNIEPKGGNKVGTWGGSAQVKADGTFEFTGVPPGEYVLTAQPSPGREAELSAPQPIVVKPGKPVEVTIVSDSTAER